MSQLHGLVACGGKSSRMGTDKSLLNYHGKPQRYHLYELMKSLCERVFISCNALQAPDIPSEYEVLVDDPEYRDIGPMAALLTAFKHYPEATFILVGCDYPYINAIHLQKLSKATLQTMNAVSFYNDEAKVYDPLLSGYQSHMKSLIENNFKQNQYSLQRILKDLPADVIELQDNISIQSIDTPYEYEKLMMQLCITNKYNAK